MLAYLWAIIGQGWEKPPNVQCDVLLSWYDTMSIKYKPDQCITPEAPIHPGFFGGFFLFYFLG